MVKLTNVFIWEKGMENKGKLWLNDDASIGAAAVGRKAHLGTK